MQPQYIPRITEVATGHKNDLAKAKVASEVPRGTRNLVHYEVLNFHTKIRCRVPNMKNHSQKLNSAKTVQKLRRNLFSGALRALLNLSGIRSTNSKSIVSSRLHSFRARIETLESRALLATYVVDSLAHGNDGNSGTTTLVEAIQLANANPDQDTIVLTSGGNYLSDDATFIDGTSAVAPCTRYYNTHQNLGKRRNARR